ncbi:MAG: T9SS type A sorting domain-containing protein [Bacteroidota bacterium]
MMPLSGLKSRLCLFILLFSSSLFEANAQIIPVITDDFETYPGYQVCPGYTTDIQVYPVHGTNSSKGLRAFMNSFDSKDSLLTSWLKPLPFAIFGFDFRIMEASALYPFIPATINAGDHFTILFTTDGQQWITLEDINSTNFTPATAFTHLDIPVPACDSARFKFLVTRTNNPIDYFVDIDNFDLSNYLVGINQPDGLETARAYPTVFDDQFTLESSESTPYPYELSDLHGKQVKNGFSTGKFTHIETTELSTGNYQLRIFGKKSIRTFKLMKIK